MTDITLTTTDLELVTLTINAVSLLGLGLVMIYAKKLEAFEPDCRPYGTGPNSAQRVHRVSLLSVCVCIPETVV